MVVQGDSFLKQAVPTGIEFQPKIKRVDFLDRRFYKVGDKNGRYYPSVTNILNALPVSPMFMEWVKDVGHNAEIIRTRAAKEGSQTHDAIERLIKGEKISWVDDKGNAKYSLSVWNMILRFANFYELYKPEPIYTETFLWSDKHCYAGTVDFVCKLGGEIWIIDFKTSNSLSKSYDLQLAAYRQALLECKGLEATRAGVLWLKAATRKPSKREGIYQGEGWQIKEVANLDTDFEAFLNVQKIFRLFNPETEPVSKSYPTEIQLQ